MAKKSKKRRRSGGGPAGKPGAATKAQSSQRQKSKGAQKGTKGGSKTKKDTDKAGRRSLVDVAKGTSQTQRVTISVVIVVLAAVGGYFGGRSKASNTFRYSYESNAIDAVADGGEAGDPVEVTVDELALCVTPAEKSGDYSVVKGTPTDGKCPAPEPDATQDPPPEG